MGSSDEMVSIVVPVYNAARYVKECICSLQKQTYHNLEIIVVSDGSTDKSAAICRELQQDDCRIQVHEKENGGVSSARNMGIHVANGQYLMFADSDDWLEPNTVEVMLRTIIENKVDACFSNCYYRNEATVVKATSWGPTEKVESGRLIEKHLKYQFIASPWLTMVRLAKVKQCLFSESIHTLEDWEYNFRMLTCIDSAAIIDVPLYHYREVIGSTSKSKLNERKLSCFQIPDRVAAYVRENDLPYQDLTDYVWIFLLNHMLVILATNEYTPVAAKKLKAVAKDKLGYALMSELVPLKQRIYTLMCALSPRVFCAFYHLKYLWIKILRKIFAAREET